MHSYCSHLTEVEAGLEASLEGACLQDSVRAYNAAREVITAKQKQVKENSLLCEPQTSQA